MPDSPSAHDLLIHQRDLLCALGTFIQQQVCEGRRRQSSETMSQIVDVTESDTIYAIDKISEEAVLSWFQTHWPSEQPVELIMEGLHGDSAVTFPSATAPQGCQWKCIIDPIDGTRPLMYDKRSAWVLCGLAPHRGQQNQLQDICVAVMTELPTTKAGFVDQISAIKGKGRDGILALRTCLATKSVEPFTPRPSQATTIEHGFGQFTKFFPDGKSLTAAMEERLCELLTGNRFQPTPLLFDDQYLSTGGQFYEILVGHDRFCADLRPEVFTLIGCQSSLVCHPYDACCWLILAEAGCIIESPCGLPINAPLDTTSPVAWIAYANPLLAAQMKPIIGQIMAEFRIQTDSAGAFSFT